eukprot:13560826-Alexandrium_andersonii.AAC.1
MQSCRRRGRATAATAAECQQRPTATRKHCCGQGGARKTCVASPARPVPPRQHAAATVLSFSGPW